MKKIMVLGAMQMHVLLIKRLKELNYFVITVDYFVDSIGHRYADQQSYESTTNVEAVLHLAMAEKVDGVLTYNSDPAALTAAYVSNQMNLPGNPPDAVRIMSEKDRFRSFLKEHDYPVPDFRVFTSLDQLKEEMHQIKFPVVVKPVDSSGSKGVKIAENEVSLLEAFDVALGFSRAKRVILEEYIPLKDAQIHGDAFVLDGQLLFSCFGDHHFDDKVQSNVPYATTFPSEHSPEIIKRLNKILAEFILKVGFKNGGINVEARVSAENNKIYLIEVGPRNGGNFTPKVIEYHTRFNFVDAAINVCVGEKFVDYSVSPRGFYSYLVIKSTAEGVFKEVKLSNKIKKRMLEMHMYKKEGDRIHSFSGANQAVGVILLEYQSQTEMIDIVKNFRDHIEVVLETE